MNLAEIYESTGRDAKGHLLREEAVRIRSEGDQDPTLAMIIHQSGMICLRSGRPQEALEHFQQSLQLRRSLFGQDHPEVAMAVGHLALAYLDLKDYPKVDESMEMAWSISMRVLGEEHPQTLQFLAERGLHLVTTGADGRLPEGLEMVRKAHSLAENLALDESVHEHLRSIRKAAEEIVRRRGGHVG